MTQGGKILLGLLAIGGITFAVFHSGQAHADTLPPPNPEPPNPLPGLPPIPGVTLPPAGSVIPPAGTPIPLPGGGSVLTPVIPGANAPPVQSGPPPIVPLPASTSPFPAGGGTVNIPGVGPVAVPALPAGLPSLPQALPSGLAPPDTLILAKSMLTTERLPHWRVTDPNLKAWQASRRRVADGQFGTGDALALAQEIGTIPIIRAWPRGSFPGDGKLDEYRAALQQIANAAPEPRASELRQSAAREQGQGYGTPEKPIATLITLE